MSIKELNLYCIGGSLHFNTYYDDFLLIPLVEKVGDTIRIDYNQAHMLYLYLKERFEND